uniref:Repressor of RNA polymerase III transcription n=1 Tax=Spongospora subterranea TaxID=70186 RepID=A0A0H5R9B9_9EUKA|eukprot:CRZ10366.1 hypothetical protein [Spongospora subterranea]
MKFLDVPELEDINERLNCLDLGDRILNARLEAYTCRPYKEDKKLLSEISRKYNDDGVGRGQCNSPLGSMKLPSTRKLFSQLISVMNQSFIDYDFRDASPDNFKPVSLSEASRAINMHVLDPVEKEVPGLKASFWHTVDEFMDLNAADVYRYESNLDLDVFTKGKLFSCNFFFINRKKSRLVFFAAGAVSSLHSAASELQTPIASMMDMEDGACCEEGGSDDDSCQVLSSSWMGSVTLVADSNTKPARPS